MDMSRPGLQLSCMFLDTLPRELRDRIYEIYIEDSIEDDVKDGIKDGTKQHTSIASPVLSRINMRGDQIAPTHLVLNRICHQVCEEAVPIYYRYVSYHMYFNPRPHT